MFWSFSDTVATTQAVERRIRRVEDHESELMKN
jgi:hypothetical protein